MKKLIFTLCLFISSHLLANPTPQIFQGEYSYKGNHQIISLRFEEYISMENQSAEDKINHYKNDGYTCYSIGEMSTYCYKESANTQSTPELNSEIKSRYNNFTVKLYHAVQEPKLLYNSLDYKFWQVEQKTLVAGHYFPETFYSLLFDIQSISLGPDESNTQFTFRCHNKILINSEHFNIPGNDGLTLRYLVDVHLE